MDAGGAWIPHLEEADGNISSGVAVHDPGADGEGSEVDVGLVFVLKLWNALEFRPRFEASDIESIDAIDEGGIEVRGLEQETRLRRQIDVGVHVDGPALQRQGL